MKLKNGTRLNFKISMDQIRIKVVKQFINLVGKYKQSLIRYVSHVKKKQEQNISKFFAVYFEEMTKETDQSKGSFILPCNHGQFMYKKCVDNFAKTNGTCFLCDKVAHPNTNEKDTRLISLIEKQNIK